MPKRILIVDDDFDFGFMIKATLDLAGYEARAVHLGSQVCRVAHDFKPDLILLDCMMPAVDGGQVAGLLEADPALAAIPMAFLTAIVSDPVDEPSVCYTGVRTYLPKTLPLADLVDYIERATGGTGVEAVLAATPVID